MLNLTAQPMPAWLPDETLFSLASRWHRLSGELRASSTSRRLFGLAQAGTRHDFPSGLAHFVQVSDGVWGDEYALAIDHTILNFYRPFLTESMTRDLIQQMAGPSIAHLKFKLGLLTSRFRAHHPLKACPLCIQADRSQYGWAYWHLSHQYPGVWVCTKHGVLLQESMLKSTGVERFLWCLPDESHLRTWPSDTVKKLEAHLATLQHLSESIQLFSQNKHPIHTENAYLIYRRTLQDRGWLPAGERLKIDQAVEQYWHFIEPMAFIPELSALVPDRKLAQAQLIKMLRPPRIRTHPLRHFSIMSWLQLKPADFQKTEETSLLAAPNIELPVQEDSLKQAQKQAVIHSLQQGFSMHKAAKVHGIDTQTAMVWAAQAGISSSRRPKKLKPDVWARLIDGIKSGQDKKVLAGLCAISITTVTAVMRTEVGLHDAWQLARYENKRIQSQNDWLALQEAFPGWGTKALRLENPAAYIWLYRHDQDWLKAHLPEGIKNRIRKAPVNWDQRDADLSLQVQRTALKLVLAGHAPVFRLWELYQAIPELKAKFNAIERLPKTKWVIESLLKPPRR
nr:TnsD family Tn7-like transposition protein [uncultured Deefgea sp.]